MADREPVAELEPRFSSDGATPTSWTEGRERLRRAEVYWLTTVRPGGSPHVTPLLAVWLDGALHFCTGPDERKARNLAGNPPCVLTTGCDALGEGLDLLVEGEAVRLTDDPDLRRVSDAYLSKYGEGWRFAVRDGAFYHGPGPPRETDPGAAWVYEVAPKKAFGFGKGGTFSQTRWRFQRTQTREMEGEIFMKWTLEVVVVPVSDVERAKAFYAGKLGFDLDHDTKISDEYHVVQLTPPGSGCSIVLGKGIVDMKPGSLKGLQLVVKDIRAARAQLVGRGVGVGEVQVVGASGPRPASDGEDLDNVGFVFFEDPDGNGWAVQQISARD